MAQISAQSYEHSAKNLTAAFFLFADEIDEARRQPIVLMAAAGILAQAARRIPQPEPAGVQPAKAAKPAAAKAANGDKPAASPPAREPGLFPEPPPAATASAPAAGAPIIAKPGKRGRKASAPAGTAARAKASAPGQDQASNGAVSQAA